MLIGLLQYIFMKDVIYKNKASSLISQVRSIPHFNWEYPGINLENEAKYSQRIFFPETSLAFIDVQGSYAILSMGPGSAEPPRFDRQVYLNALKKPEHDRPGSQDSPRVDRPEHLDILKRSPGPDYKIIHAGGAEQLIVLQPVIERGQILGIVQISTLTGPLKELLIRQLLTFLFLSLTAMLFGLFGFLPILRRTLVPLYNMVDTTEQIDAGNLAKRFPTQQGQLEIDGLSESFNGMLERLEASFETERETKEQMRRFIADASHELRTPLTSIHGFLEVLLRGAANQPEQLHKALKSMHGESERLNKIVQDLILLAKMDRTSHIELAEGQLETVVNEMEPQFRILAGNRTLDLQIQSNIKCKFDRDKMKQVILNLFHNAVQHTDPDRGKIRIELVKTDMATGYLFRIMDQG
ncbi:hypothetical protein N752_23925 [Desulforamulus aquiferis]|nr:hypothetical protein N752_23925 [Desulforamulus aquiferis]